MISTMVRTLSRVPISLRSLEQKADKLKERIEFLQRVQTKELELRSVLERAAPAKKIEATEETPVVEKRTVFAVPKASRPLKGFRSEERAYRAGMAIRAGLFNDDEARRWCMDHGVESRAQAGGINSLGGVLTNAKMARLAPFFLMSHGKSCADDQHVCLV